MNIQINNNKIQLSEESIAKSNLIGSIPNLKNEELLLILEELEEKDLNRIEEIVNIVNRSAYFVGINDGLYRPEPVNNLAHNVIPIRTRYEWIAKKLFYEAGVDKNYLTMLYLEVLGYRPNSFDTISKIEAVNKYNEIKNEVLKPEENSHTLGL